VRRVSMNERVRIIGAGRGLSGDAIIRKLAEARKEMDVITIDPLPPIPKPKDDTSLSDPMPRNRAERRRAKYGKKRR